MRLLDVSSLTLSEFGDDEIPSYAILSHTWSSDELTYEDVIERRNIRSAGYEKTSKVAKFVRTELKDIRWLWVDTCCINKSDSAELSDAINSMFRWYRDAAVCLVYLADVTATEDEDMFKRSRWFTRGWTLQELIAPEEVLFFTRDWDLIGRKGIGTTGLCGSPVISTACLESAIHSATGIPRNVLHGYQRVHDVPVTERWRWTENRRTTREEDMAYCLFGLFGVAMPVNYGEGFYKAKARLFTQLPVKESHFRLEWDFGPSYSHMRIGPPKKVIPVGGGDIEHTTDFDSYERALYRADRSWVVIWEHDQMCWGIPLASYTNSKATSKITNSIRLGDAIVGSYDTLSTKDVEKWLLNIDGLDEVGPLDHSDLSEKPPHYFEEIICNESRVASKREARKRALATMESISWILQEQGRWEEAEGIEQRVLDSKSKILGPDHPGTLASMHNLASIMQNTGRVDAARELVHDVLAWEKEMLGAVHPATLTTTDHLALLLQSAGRLQEAETMSRHAFESFEKVLGHDHVDTWTSAHNLASILHDCGRLQESRTLLRRTAARREQILGQTHPNTLSSVSCLASVLMDMEQYEEAERLNRIVLEARERIFGPEHPQTLTSVSNLGLVLRCCGRYEEAKTLTRRALEGYRRTLGDGHPHTLTSTTNLADLLEEQDHRAYRTTIEERRPRRYARTEKTERVLGKHKRSSVRGLNLAARGNEKVKRSKTKGA